MVKGKIAKLWKTENGKIRCLACAHKCLIENDNTGICSLRKNLDGKLFLLNFGRVIAIAKDPIEKKPLYNFLPGTYAFSIGFVGCNFKCKFCQNYEISQLKEAKDFGRKISPEEIVEKAIKTNCQSIAYTYTEPIISIEFVKEIAILAKKKGLKNILVTNGYWSEESFEFIKNYVDAVNIDLKSFKNEFYIKECSGRLKPVLNTIKRCVDYGIHTEITTLIIPKENDDDEELEKIAKFIAELDENIVWHITRFFPMYKKLDSEITPINVLKKAEKIGKKYLKNVYIGNV